MICVVVPTYNEASTLPILLDALLALPDEYEVLVVDDASPDGTAEIALAMRRVCNRVHVILREGGRGYGLASKEGLRWALDRGYRIACTIDGDLTHDPSAMPRLVACVDDGADAAIGSRFAPGGGYEPGFPLSRRMLTRSGNAYARLMMRARARDNTSGYRCYTADALRRVNLDSIRSDGYFFLIELICALRDRGARIDEVPIRYATRAKGVSKISIPLVAEAFGRVTALGFEEHFGSARPPIAEPKEETR